MIFMTKKLAFLLCLLFARSVYSSDFAMEAKNPISGSIIGFLSLCSLYKLHKNWVCDKKKLKRLRNKLEKNGIVVREHIKRNPMVGGIGINKVYVTTFFPKYPFLLEDYKSDLVKIKKINNDQIDRINLMPTSVLLFLFGGSMAMRDKWFLDMFTGMCCVVVSAQLHSFYEMMQDYKTDV